MTTMQELIPFAKEMLSQRPSRALLKVYLLGSVFAALGTVLGLVEAVCRPFSGDEPSDADMLFFLNREQELKEEEMVVMKRKEMEEEVVEKTEIPDQSGTLLKGLGMSQRPSANRLHAS